MNESSEHKLWARIERPRVQSDSDIDPRDLQTAENAAFFFRQLSANLQRNNGFSVPVLSEGLLLAACQEFAPFCGREEMASRLERKASMIRGEVE